tara:strand:- start:12163 stop:12348 length:186 start_codon:yes stop_codon:yes gene_type:complete
MKKKNYNLIIDKISKAREKNNKNWMNLLKIAFESDPNNTKKIMRNINSQDKKISNLVKKLN